MLCLLKSKTSALAYRSPIEWVDVYWRAQREGVVKYHRLRDRKTWLSSGPKAKSDSVRQGQKPIRDTAAISSATKSLSVVRPPRVNRIDDKISLPGCRATCNDEFCRECCNLQVEKQETNAQEKAAATKAIADSAQKDLDEALPALEIAVACLKDLKKLDIDEVKNSGRLDGMSRVFIQNVRDRSFTTWGRERGCIYFTLAPRGKAKRPGRHLRTFVMDG